MCWLFEETMHMPHFDAMNVSLPLYNLQAERNKTAYRVIVLFNQQNNT